MFSSNRSRYGGESFSKHRASKSKSNKKNPSFRDPSSTRKVERLAQQAQASSPQSNQTSPTIGSAIITLSVGREQRLFAAHEDVLCHSPFFATACRDQFFSTTNKRIELPDEEPEVFSSLLEYLYKGDYYPRLEYDKRRNSWNLEDGGNGNGNGNGTAEAIVYTPQGPILKDTVIYCAADRYGLHELKKLALKKQGLQSGIQCSTILSSARFAYAHTPDNDSKLRAHYLALIIRARHTFKRSGTMQNEMENGGKLFFDLFVAMVNHMDDLAQKTPR
ncbi:uncharacterized protein BDR25DRAFT_278773 [Lindgomyces ingoldianus]|uniref:Uncharacterized protein n=1 Tax=Lindgomyces ingoldianus TaxID=673940 RepID=A0ACB6RA56_9PLEO|nr:uncharacterized protein BDR25DRAFT_278773 [Lindgomyces ingoldianus]KAF2476021.1 hypothetical protein BDR25DRAFT_278773 [Lindgomyces ingoldianus]